MVDVIVAGGGPTGMMLAAELTLAGVDAAVVERRPTPELVGSRAGGFHSRTIEILDQRGIADRFLAEGQRVQAAFFGNTTLDVSDFPTRHPYTLGLWQNHIERILARWIEELGVPVQRGLEVAGFAQDGSGVDVHLADGGSLRARTWSAPTAGEGQGSRHRVPRLGCDQEQPDRRSGGDRGDTGRHAHRRGGGTRAAPDGGRADHACGGHREATWTGDRTHFG